MAKVSKETEQKIAQLQMMEQNMQSFMMQRQQFQAQMMEVENAIKELGNAKGATYKMAGSVLIASDKATLQKDLNAKKEIIDLRLKNIRKQEDAIKEKAEKLQSEVIGELKPGKEE